MMNYKIKISRNVSMENFGIFFPILLVSLFPILFKWMGIQERFSSVACLVSTTALLLFVMIKAGKNVTTSKFLTLLLINIACLILTISMHNSVGVVVIHLNSILAIHLLNNIQFSKKQVAFAHCLLSVFIFMWLLSLDTTLIWKSFVYEPSGLYVNPCTFAIMTLTAYYHALLAVDIIFENNKYLKVVSNLALLVVAYHFIDISICRASLMALFAYWLMQPFKNLITRNYRKTIFLFLLFSFLFPVAYIVLYKFTDGMQFFGKNFFTGRQIVWGSVFENIGENWLFGAGSGNDISLNASSLMDDAHNYILGVWKNIGVVSVIAVVITLCTGKNLTNISNLNKNAKIMFLSCLIVSTVETVLNGGEFYIFYITLLMTVKQDPQKIENTENIDKVYLKRGEYNERALCRK